MAEGVHRHTIIYDVLWYDAFIVYDDVLLMMCWEGEEGGGVAPFLCMYSYVEVLRPWAW